MPQTNKAAEKWKGKGGFLYGKNGAVTVRVTVRVTVMVTLGLGSGSGLARRSR